MEIMEPKMFGPKKCWGPIIFGTQKFYVLEKFGSWKVLVQKIFGPTNLSSLKFWFPWLRHLLGNFQTACSHLPDIFQTPSIHHQTPPKHFPDILKCLLGFAFAGLWVWNWPPGWSGPACKLEPARSKQSLIPSWAWVWQLGIFRPNPSFFGL